MFPLTMTPIRPSSLHGSTRVVRQKTPSPEKAGYSIVHVSPRKRRNVEAVETPTKRPASDSLPETTMMVETTSITSSLALEGKQVAFDFNLCENGVFRAPDEDEIDLIMAAFPGASSLEASPPFIVLRYPEKLCPPKPWPISVAGAPLFIHTKSMTTPPMHYGRHGRAKPFELTPAPTLWKHPTDEMLDAIDLAYRDEFGTNISKIGWYGGRFVVWLSDSSSDTTKLPGQIGRMIVTYRYDVDGHNREAALRAKLPLGETYDDSDYGVDLRPGVMLGSGVDPITGEERLTTSGVPLTDPRDGQHYVTVPRHGFPSKSLVYHPNGSGRSIGEIHTTLGATDISLMRLRPGIKYSRETFSSDYGQGAIIKELRPWQTVRLYDPIHFDSPFSGRCDGQVVGKLFEKIPADEKVSKEHWIRSEFIYTGNGRDEIADGTCGSVIWDDEERAVAFYRFYTEEDGMSLAVSVEPLVRLGMSIDEIA